MGFLLLLFPSPLTAIALVVLMMTMLMLVMMIFMKKSADTEQHDSWSAFALTFAMDERHRENKRRSTEQMPWMSDTERIKDVQRSNFVS